MEGNLSENLSEKLSENLSENLSKNLSKPGAEVPDKAADGRCYPPSVTGVEYGEKGLPSASPRWKHPDLWQHQAKLGEIVMIMVGRQAFIELARTLKVTVNQRDWNQCVWLGCMMHIPLIAVVGSPEHFTQLIMYGLLANKGLILEETWFRDEEGGVIHVTVFVGKGGLEDYRVKDIFGDKYRIPVVSSRDEVAWWPSWPLLVDQGFSQSRIEVEYRRELMVYPQGGPFNDPGSDASKMSRYWIWTFNRRDRCGGNGGGSCACEC